MVFIYSRKKSKWDQPAESFVTAGILVPGVPPLGNMGVSVAAPVSTMNNVAASYGHVPQVLLAPLMQQHVTALAQKIHVRYRCLFLYGHLCYQTRQI